MSAFSKARTGSDSCLTNVLPSRASMSGVGIILLAAGGSSRMGAPKQLLRLEGKSLIRRAAETAVASECSPTMVVLGAYADEIRPELQGAPVHIVETPRWESGMGSSIAAGLEALLAGATTDLGAVVIMLCDQPYVSTALLNALVQASRADCRAIVAAEYGGKAGVPALFPRCLFPELARLDGATGAKPLFAKYRDRVITIPFGDGLHDIDTPDDYRRVCDGPDPGSY